MLENRPQISIPGLIIAWRIDKYLAEFKEKEKENSKEKTAFVSGDFSSISAEDVTKHDIYRAQYEWGPTALARLVTDRRVDLCKLLRKLVKSLAPELEPSRMYEYWGDVISSPTIVYIDYP